MTNLEAIKAKLTYPLAENAFIVALEDRGIASDGIYVSGESFDLAYADTIIMLVTTPSIKEGGFSINLVDKETLLRLADKIYKKYDVVSPISSLKKKATFVQRF